MRELVINRMLACPTIDSLIGTTWPTSLGTNRNILERKTDKELLDLYEEFCSCEPYGD